MVGARDRLPYTGAVLLEVLRCGNIVPQGLQHTASRYINIIYKTLYPREYTIQHTASRYIIYKYSYISPQGLQHTASRYIIYKYSYIVPTEL